MVTPDLVAAEGESTPAIQLVILKGDRELRLYLGEELEATFPIGLGFEPVGHKLREGDGKTPEGEYKVCVKNPNSRYYLSLGIDYPGAQDAVEALAAGRISEADAEAIRHAEAVGGCPPWDTALGGEIFIHGWGASSDWTLGCVALDDPAMQRLFETIPLGTPVSIRP